jgi:hypothetical protein
LEESVEVVVLDSFEEAYCFAVISLIPEQITLLFPEEKDYSKK